MKRFLATTLILGVCSSFGLLGCADESKVKETHEVSTPNGTVKETVEKKVETTGDASPATTPTEPAPAPK